MIRLLINKYKDLNPKRNNELEMCLKRNIQSFGSNGVIFSRVDRPTFSDLFYQINLSAEPEDITVIANSDIYFESIFDFNLIQANQVYALSRWDWQAGKATLYDHEDSQDVWAFRGKIKPVSDCDFGLGVPGCDNAIAERLQRAGYTVLNPSRSIKSIHLHTSNVRNYNPKTAKAVDKPYLLIKPHFYNETPSYRNL